jgi:hypothetical protein
MYALEDYIESQYSMRNAVTCGAKNLIHWKKCTPRSFHHIQHSHFVWLDNQIMTDICFEGYWKIKTHNLEGELGGYYSRNNIKEEMLRLGMWHKR